MLEKNFLYLTKVSDGIVEISTLCSMSNALMCISISSKDFTPINDLRLLFNSSATSCITDCTSFWRACAVSLSLPQKVTMIPAATILN